MKKIIRTTIAILLSISIIMSHTITANASSKNNISDSFDFNERFLFDLVSDNSLYNIGYEKVNFTIDGVSNDIQIIKPSNKISYKSGSETVKANYIVLDSNNSVIGFIKAGKSDINAIRSIITKANEISYTGTSTFNKTAEKMGLDIRLVGEELEQEKLNSLAEKAIGSSIGIVVSKIANNNSYTALVKGAVSYTNSIISGKTDAEAFSSSTTTTVNSAAKESVKVIVSTTALSLGASEVVAAMISIAAGFIAGNLVYEYLEDIEDRLNIDATLAEAYDVSMTNAAELCIDIEDGISEGNKKAKKTTKKAAKALVSYCKYSYDFYSNIGKYAIHRGKGYDLASVFVNPK